MLYCFILYFKFYSDICIYVYLCLFHCRQTKKKEKDRDLQLTQAVRSIYDYRLTTGGRHTEERKAYECYSILFFSSSNTVVPTFVRLSFK
jgi:hypothetical protein